MRGHVGLTPLAVVGCLMGVVAVLSGDQRPPVADTRATPVSMQAIQTQCLEFADVKRGPGPGDYRACRVSEFGDVGAVDGQTYYAIYCLMPNDTAGERGECGDDSFIGRYHAARAMRIFVRDAASPNPRVLFERADVEIGTVLYEKPELIPNAQGTILYLPIRIDGTGVGNDSEYYLRAAGTWAPLEAEAWQASLVKQLPQGLGIWKGVWPDLKTMRAEAGLYREGDANCCPTGGEARVRLAIRGRQIVIESVVIDAGAP